MEKSPMDNAAVTISMESLLDNRSCLEEISDSMQTSKIKECSTNHECPLRNCSMENDCIVHDSTRSHAICMENHAEDSLENTRNVLLCEMEEECLNLGIAGGCNHEDDDISIDSDLLTLKPRNKNLECSDSDIE